ncbi:MAG: AAA family ATPase [Nitrososphaeria archaeon]
MPQIKKLRIRNLLTYEDSGWIELGRRALIVGPNGSGKTNIIRALRLLRAMADLEEIRPAEVLNYLHDPSKPLAGIDLEVMLSDEEVEAAYDLLRYYVENSIAYLYDFGEHSDELKELLRNVRISMSWTRDKRPTDPSGRMMYGYHELAFPGLHLRLLGSGVGFYIAHEEGIAYESPSSQAEFPVERWADPQAEHACKTKKELLENLLATLEKTPDRAQLGERLDATMRSCAGSKGIVPSQDIHPSVNYAVKDASRRIADIYQMAGISQPAATGYGTSYLLLRIILGGLLFAGSERPLSGLSKLSALRGFLRYDLVKEEDLVKVLDDVGARYASLDAYLRNVEPFLAYLYLSSGPEGRQRFRRISRCFSRYFRGEEVGISSERLEVQPRPRSNSQETGAQLKVWLADSAREEDAAVLQYPRIYLREKEGGREVEIPIDMAGQGHRELLSLLTALIGRPGSVVFLDEPASNVHPTLLFQFLMDLLGRGECSRELGRNQVIVITHSPAVAKLFMEADIGASKKNPTGEGLPNILGLSIIKVHRGRDGASVIGYLTPDEWQGGSEEFLKKAIGRIVDPSVLFAKGVVLVEGPADRAFLEMALRLSGWWEELLRNDIEIVHMNSKYNLKHYKGLLDELKIPYLAILDGDARKNPLGNEPDDSICVLKPPSEGEGCVDAVIHEGCRYILLEPKELEGFLGGLGLDVKGEPDPEEWYELIEEEVKNNPDFNRKFECAGKILSQLIVSTLNGSPARRLSGRLSGLAFMGTRSPAASYHRGIARGPRYPTSPISPSSLLTLSLRIE